MSEEEVFPWSTKNETIETLHAQLQANGSDVSLQRLREIQLKIIESICSLPSLCFFLFA
jgi:hypothetical protein